MRAAARAFHQHRAQSNPAYPERWRQRQRATHRARLAARVRDSRTSVTRALVFLRRERHGGSRKGEALRFAPLPRPFLYAGPPRTAAHAGQCARSSRGLDCENAFASQTAVGARKESRAAARPSNGACTQGTEAGGRARFCAVEAGPRGSESYGQRVGRFDVGCLSTRATPHGPKLAADAGEDRGARHRSFTCYPDHTRARPALTRHRGGVRHGPVPGRDMVATAHSLQSLREPRACHRSSGSPALEGSANCEVDARGVCIARAAIYHRHCNAKTKARGIVVLEGSVEIQLRASRGEPGPSTAESADLIFICRCRAESAAGFTKCGNGNPVEQHRNERHSLRGSSDRGPIFERAAEGANALLCRGREPANAERAPVISYRDAGKHGETAAAQPAN